MSDDLFERQVEEAVQIRLNDEKEKFFNNPLLIIKAYQERLAQVENEIKAVQPKIDFYDSVTMSDDWMEMTVAVKSIEWAGKPLGRNKMFKLMRDNSILREGSFCKNEPYQKYVDLGYFRIVETKWENGNGETFVGRKTVVSQKGLDFLIKLVNEAYDGST